MNKVEKILENLDLVRCSRAKTKQALIQHFLSLAPKDKDLPITIRCSTGEKFGQWECGFAEGYNDAIKAYKARIKGEK